MSNRLTRLVAALAVIGPFAAIDPDAQATFPGGNGRIAFSLESKAGRTSSVTLRDHNPRTGRTRRLTAPTCSPRGFEEDEYYWYDTDPDYSPDGRHIAYLHDDACPGGEERRGVWVVRADGSRRRQVVHLPTVGPGIHPDHTNNPSSVAFSPDGERVVVAYRGSSAEYTNFDLYVHEVFSVADGALVLRYESGVDEYAISGDVDWSARGWIAAGMNGSIHMLRPDGSGRRRLTRSPSDASPDWSPSGRTILFVRDREENCEPCYGGGWMVRVSTSTGRSRVRRRGYLFSPVLSPRMNRIAYTDGYALYSMGVRRGRPRRLTRRFPQYYLEPIRGIDWQPRR